jgi:hypothetical protein
MSYEGHTQLICANGHHHTYDAYDDGESACPTCGGAWTHRHDVDVTNGYDETHPSTCNAPVIEIGFTDVWHEDHYGNRYAIKCPLVAPDGPHWTVLEKA